MAMKAIVKVAHRRKRSKNHPRETVIIKCVLILAVMSTDDDSKSIPQSMRHKKILAVAGDNPEASVTELASMVPSATSDLVERVLEAHGDPATEGNTEKSEEEEGPSSNDPPTHNESSDTEASPIKNPTGTETPEEESPGNEDSSVSGGESDGHPPLDNLPEKHRKLLEAVASQPTATQEKIAEYLDVTRATVSRWAKNIEGFEWSERKSFVEPLFDDSSSADFTEREALNQTNSTEEDQQDSSPSARKDTEIDSKKTTEEIMNEVSLLEERVKALEQSDEEGVTDDGSVFDDPELVHKVAHACMKSDNISESEELRILKALLD